MQVPQAGRAAGTRADRVGLVVDEDRAGALGELAHRLEVAGLGQDDPDVRQGGLDEHGRDVAVGERGLEPRDVVELDDACGLGDVDLRPDRAADRHDPAAAVVGKHRDGLVHRAVVAVVVDEHLGAAADVAGQPERESIGVGRGQRELPGGQSEPAGQLLADPGGVLGREHVGDAEAHLALDGGDRRGRAVAGHRPRIAEAEVDVVVPIDAAERGTRRGLDVEGERPGPLDHPGHRHALEEGGLGTLVELGRARVLPRERLALGGMEFGETGPIDGAVGGRVRGHPPMMAAPRAAPAVIPPGATWSARPGARRGPEISGGGAGSRRWDSWRPRCRDRPRGSWRSRSSRNRDEARRSSVDACGASPTSVRRRTPSWFGSTWVGCVSLSGALRSA